MLLLCLYILSFIIVFLWSKECASAPFTLSLVCFSIAESQHSGKPRSSCSSTYPWGGDYWKIYLAMHQHILINYYCYLLYMFLIFIMIIDDYWWLWCYCYSYCYFIYCIYIIIQYYTYRVTIIIVLLFFSPPTRWGLLDFMSVACSSSSSPRLLSSCSLPDLNHDHPRPVCPAGPQPRPSPPSVPCRTSTASIHAQCSLPDLNHDHPRPVFPAGPQPRPSTPSVPCRTSTASIHAKCSLPDLM